jgi:hypothetical protein
MDARLTRALIRDEGRLRAALAEQEKRRFDVDTALTVRYRVEDLLETVSLIVQDDDFWVRLSGIDRPPSFVQLERVRELDPLAFAALLEAAGYRSPPPPPVDELVDDTIQALVVALTSSTTVYPDQVGGARWQLQTLVVRVRRQISEQETPELAPSILRSSARSLGRAARWLIPPVAATTVGAIVEAHVPGSGIGHIVGRAVERTAEDLAQLGAEMLIGDPAPVSAAVSVDEPGWTEIDPVSVHLAAVSDELHRLIIATHHNMPVEYVRYIVSDARRHLNRIEELANDSRSETIGVAVHIQGIQHLLDTLSQPILMAGDPPVSVAQRAIEVVEGLREELQQAAEPRPEEGHRRPMPA